jgi:hypothetical protein
MTSTLLPDDRIHPCGEGSGALMRQELIVLVEFRDDPPGFHISHHVFGGTVDVGTKLTLVPIPAIPSHPSLLLVRSAEPPTR